MGNAGELLGVAIGNIRLGKKVFEKIENDYPNDLWVRHCGVEELVSEYKVPRKKAEQIQAVIKIGHRINQLGRKTEKLDCPKKIELYFDWLKSKGHEEAWIVFLDSKLQVIGKVQLGRGGQSEAIIDYKEAVKGAFMVKAYGCILCHNHPSGISNPSGEDIRITEKVQKMLDIAGFTLLDHVIVGSEGYYSFKEHGKL